LRGSKLPISLKNSKGRQSKASKTAVSSPQRPAPFEPVLTKKPTLIPVILEDIEDQKGLMKQTTLKRGAQTTKASKNGRVAQSALQRVPTR
jgi:hypothetical protein